PVYYDGDSVSGQVVICVRDGKRMQHDGIKVQFVGHTSGCSLIAISSTITASHIAIKAYPHWAAGIDFIALWECDALCTRQERDSWRETCGHRCRTCRPRTGLGLVRSFGIHRAAEGRGFPSPVEIGHIRLDIGKLRFSTVGERLIIDMNVIAINHCLQLRQRPPVPLHRAHP
ncbi:hypothetical protein FB45DRAFT_769283, partial [Roridomyces roridus]